MKKIASVSALLLMLVLLAGCSAAPAQDQSKTEYVLNTILKTTDSGKTWKNPVTDIQSKTVLAPEILAVAIDPSASETILVGTEKNGLYVSSTGGASWKKADFPLRMIFGLEVASGSGPIYAAGLLDERAKIFKTDKMMTEWKEIYSEPANGTIIYSLAMDPGNPEVVYAGTSGGMIIKTVDGGQEWKNLTKAEGPVNAIVFDRNNRSVVYFSVFNQGLLRTKDGGEKFEDIGDNLEGGLFGTNVLSLAADPANGGSLYVGFGGGILRGKEYGDKFEALNILESSKDHPIRSIAVNPQNGNEMFYGAAQAIYRSDDRGARWSTYQLNTARTIFQLKYDPQNAQVIYLGLRKTN